MCTMLAARPGLLIILVLVGLLVGACSQPEPAPEIQATVEATIEALPSATPPPTATVTPTPVPTQTPTQTPTPTQAPTPTPEVLVEELLPTPTHEAMVMEEPAATPTGEAMAVAEPTITAIQDSAICEAAATSEATEAKPAVQEFAILENYRATRFFPKEIVVLKDVPVKLYLSRLHREHINLFKILPWLTSTEVILPGQIGVIEFVPDQLGEFEIRNVGHSFEAKLLVVECIEQAKQRIVDKGVKMLALIHSTDDSQVFPEKSLVVKDIPVKIFNITLMAEDRISVAPFYVPDDINVRPQEINSFDFTPDSVGEFPIRDELRGFAGTLLVEDAE